MASSKLDMLRKKKEEAERKQKEKEAMALKNESQPNIAAPSTIIDVLDAKGDSEPLDEDLAEDTAEDTKATEADDTSAGKKDSKKSKKSFKGKIERKEDRVITKPKDEVPEDEKNPSISHSFAIDRDTLMQLTAVVKLLKASGARIDDRVVTESSFVRKAIIDEFAVLYKKNGDAFKEAVEREMNLTPDIQNFSI